MVRRWLWLLSFCLFAVLAAGLMSPPWARRTERLRSRGDGEDSASFWQRRLHNGVEKNTARAKRGGVVHFLFLLNSTLPNAQIWRRFLDEAPSPDSYRVWVHCTDARCTDHMPPWRELTAVPTVPSFYCGDLVSPMVQLAKVASQRAHQADKFVFLSDSTLPIKPFRDVRAALLRDRRSDFCVDAALQWPTAHVEGGTYRMVKHEQWVVLSYRHAKQLARHWDWGADATKQKIRIGSGKKVERKLFKPYRCSDEVMMFATIFGAYADFTPDRVSRNATIAAGANLASVSPAAATRLWYAGLGSLDPSKEQDYQGRCRTLVKFGPRDGRDPARDLALRRVGRDRSSTVLTLGGSHPVEFSEVGESGLVALRRSPFLFARKWPDDVERTSPLFSTVMSEAYRING